MTSWDQVRLTREYKVLYQNPVQLTLVSRISFDTINLDDWLNLKMTLSCVT